MKERHKMADYIKRVDALKAATLAELDAEFVIESICRIPAADVREVVTCEACVWHVDDGTHYCNKWCEPCPDNAEFFCAYGERDKEDKR